jgi:hypothetical protein
LDEVAVRFVHDDEFRLGREAGFEPTGERHTGVPRTEYQHAHS